MLDTSKSVHHLVTSPGVILVGQSSEMKKEVIAVNTILRPPKKVGFSILVASIQLGQKTEVTLGRNIDQVYYLR